MVVPKLLLKLESKAQIVQHCLWAVGDRQSLHGHLQVTIGLQPFLLDGALGAECYFGVVAKIYAY